MTQEGITNSNKVISAGKLAAGVGIIASLGIAAGIFLKGSIRPTPSFSAQEFNQILEVYNHEIERRGGSVTVSGAIGEPLDAVSQVLSLGEETAPVRIGGKTYSAGEYNTLKKSLIKKVENRKK